ncbi:MAG: acetyltransferase [Chitinophagia bacterium]|nr:acetyltransferase [Chitinophagia bacterium]
MQQLIIIGARGFGREIYHHATQCAGYNTEFTIKGFLDDKADALAGYPNYPPILDSVENYTAQPDDVFCCALGAVEYKEKYTTMVLAKGGRFLNLIHPSANVNPSCKMGIGVIVCAFAFVSNDTVLGNFVTLQTHTAVGHDVVIGDYCQINSYSFFGGFCKVGRSVAINVSSTIIDRRTIGDNSTVGAGSVVIRNVKPGQTVFGNPARELL